jgi:hypothetical protein
MSRQNKLTTAAPAPTLDELGLDADETPQAPALRSESEEATAKRMLELLRAGADVRARKVRRLRAAVRVKAYENHLKLSIAVDRMVRRTLEQDPQESAA